MKNKYERIVFEMLEKEKDDYFILTIKSENLKEDKANYQLQEISDRINEIALIYKMICEFESIKEKTNECIQRKIREIKKSQKKSGDIL